jgi:hypothetical protein
VAHERWQGAVPWTGKPDARGGHEQEQGHECSRQSEAEQPSRPCQGKEKKAEIDNRR